VKLRIFKGSFAEALSFGQGEGYGSGYGNGYGYGYGSGSGWGYGNVENNGMEAVGEVN